MEFDDQKATYVLSLKNHEKQMCWVTAHSFKIWDMVRGVNHSNVTLQTYLIYDYLLMLHHNRKPLGMISQVGIVGKLSCQDKTLWGVKIVITTN